MQKSSRNSKHAFADSRSGHISRFNAENVSWSCGSLLSSSSKNHPVVTLWSEFGIARCQLRCHCVKSREKKKITSAVGCTVSVLSALVDKVMSHHACLSIKLYWQKQVPRHIWPIVSHPLRKRQLCTPQSCLQEIVTETPHLKISICPERHKTISFWKKILKTIILWLSVFCLLCVCLCAICVQCLWGPNTLKLS